MTKFSALKITDLFTAERSAGRVARLVKYKAANLPFTHIVCVESDDGSWFELDGENLEHAKKLANVCIKFTSARGCSVWAFDATTGKPGRKPVHTTWNYGEEESA